MTRFALLIEGRVLETIPECGARCGVLRLRLVTAPREVRDTARQALYDLAARSSLYGLRRKCCRRKRGPRPKIATVERRKARVSPPRDAGVSQTPGLPRYVQAQPVLSAASVRLSALRHPSFGVAQSLHPGRHRAAGTDGLFEIVRWERRALRPRASHGGEVACSEHRAVGGDGNRGGAVRRAKLARDPAAGAPGAALQHVRHGEGGVEAEPATHEIDQRVH